MEDSIAIRKKMAEYSEFIEDILKPECEDARARLQAVRSQIQEYKELQKKLREQQREANKSAEASNTSYQKILETDVDLGMKTLYCRAVAPTSSIVNKIFVHVGMNYHVEFSSKEALDFCARRIHFLEENPLAVKQTKFDEVSHHLQSAELIFKQLSSEIQKGF